MSFALAIAATVLSALFFVGGKVLMARYQMAWPSLWRWSLLSTGSCGMLAYLALGAPALPWWWCLSAGVAGSLAHVCANQAMSWGDASLLVPISGAKPLILVILMPLLMGSALPAHLVNACWLATIGIAITGLAPRRIHRHAPHPTPAAVLMCLAAVLMAVSDVCGAKGVEGAGAHAHLAAIAMWNASMGIPPLLAWWPMRQSESMANRARAISLGVLFALFIAMLALAFATATDPSVSVATVNVVVAFRGVVAVLVVLALDGFLRTGLEPLPRWVHALRLAGALVLGGAVMLAYL